MYDLTIITETEAGTKSALNHLKLAGAVIKRETDHGLKSFSYSIDKRKEGVYTTFIIELEADKLHDLNHDLTLDNKIVRHLVVKTNQVEPVATAEDHEKRSRQYKENNSSKPVIETKKETPKEKKERQDALDKKLGEILKEK